VVSPPPQPMWCAPVSSFSILLRSQKDPFKKTSILVRVLPHPPHPFSLFPPRLTPAAYTICVQLTVVSPSVPSDHQAPPAPGVPPLLPNVCPNEKTPHPFSFFAHPSPERVFGNGSQALRKSRYLLASPLLSEDVLWGL